MPQLRETVERPVQQEELFVGSKHRGREEAREDDPDRKRRNQANDAAGDEERRRLGDFLCRHAWCTRSHFHAGGQR
jgi:hypothetical protein